MAFQLRSSAFNQAQTIPKDFTGEGRDISPPLEWQEVPAGTRELALLCEDPDAPQDEPFVHWIAFKIPPDLRRLPENLPSAANLSAPRTILQGLNSFHKTGYGGPMPPKKHGAHRYFFRLYALDQELPEVKNLDRDHFLGLIKGHVIEEVALMGLYERH